jgi:hypothetical protein
MLTKLHPRSLVNFKIQILSRISKSWKIMNKSIHPNHMLIDAISKVRIWCPCQEKNSIKMGSHTIGDI